MIRILFVMILFSMSCEGGGGSGEEIIYSTGGKKTAASLGNSQPIYWDGNSDMYSLSVTFVNQ